jgi:hypothetical protein
VPVAQFTPTQTTDPADLWHGGRTTDVTRDGQQGSPLGLPGHLEHEPVDDAERGSQHTVQRAYSFAETASQIRSALRGI